MRKCVPGQYGGRPSTDSSLRAGHEPHESSWLWAIEDFPTSPCLCRPPQPWKEQVARPPCYYVIVPSALRRLFFWCLQPSNAAFGGARQRARQRHTSADGGVAGRWKCLEWVLGPSPVLHRQLVWPSKNAQSTVETRLLNSRIRSTFPSVTAGGNSGLMRPCWPLGPRLGMSLLCWQLPQPREIVGLQVGAG